MPVTGAHAPYLVRAPPMKAMFFTPYSHLLLFLLNLILVQVNFVPSFGLTEAEILLTFKGSLSNSSALSKWEEGSNPCSGGDKTVWEGVKCEDGAVSGLRLEGMGLAGKADLQNLQQLPSLKSLSLMNNSLEGPMPKLKKLGGLRSLYLSNNRFSGEIPKQAFQGISKLKKVHMANNRFTGAIPSSLSTLPKLLELRLEGNQFSGKVPEFSQNFSSFNVSNNALEGTIPASLGGIESSAFSGNKALCGQPLSKCTAKISTTFPPTATAVAVDSPPVSNSGSTSKSPSIASIVIVAIVAAVAMAAIIVAASILLRKRKQAPRCGEAPCPSNLLKKTGFREADKGSMCSTDSSRCGTKENIKLSFVRDDKGRFDLTDLLKASAEILGSGCFGSSYRAALGCPGPVMVVKRFKQMNNVGREDFQEHMRRLGRINHPNLLPLVAYYYRKEEKLLVTEYIEKGNLAVHLHGHQALGHPSLDWPTRLKIVKGIANGIAHLYKELPSLIAAHGHLKSSNVLLNGSYEPLLSDYGLVPVINQENAQELMVIYKSPEYKQLGRITKKTDVWSLGVLILETLTGKFPANFLPQGNASEVQDLASWVNTIPQEEWTNLVLDKELDTRNSEGEVVKLLRIGLACCEADVEKRLDLREAIERIDDLKEKDFDDDFYSSYASDGEGGKSRRGTSGDVNFV